MTDDNIVLFNGITKLDLPADRVLGAALRENLTGAVIVGYDKDGEFYFSSSIADGGDVLWLMELAKKRLLETCD